MIVTYGIMKASLRDTLIVINEFNSISGMRPEAITLDDGRAVKFNKDDFSLLERGYITESHYIERYVIADKRD